MNPFTKHSGLVAALDRVNVDTDQMVPKQFCKLLTRAGFGRVLFYDWRFLPGEKPNPEFELNQPRFQHASILLARANFGCGSSREHAPWAILDYGFRVVIAPSYADIFYNNCFKNGILPIALRENEVDELFKRCEAQVGYRVSANLEDQSVSDESGLKYHFDIDPFRKHCLMKGLDDIGLTLENEPSISAFEREHHPQAVMYEPVDVKISQPQN